MIAASSQELILRSPNNKIHRLPAGQEFFVAQAAAADQVCGQWMIYANSPRAKFAGVFRSSRMQSVSGALIFSIDMSDTGEEYAVILRESGVTIVCIQLSPPKCPISRYHEYLSSYCSVIGVPGPGVRSVAGGESEVGRVPTSEESAFYFIRRAVSAVEATASVKSEVSRHERGRGGDAGIDALATLRAWKAKPDWYALDTEGLHSSALRFGSRGIRARRAVRKEGLGTNLFLGAASCALLSLAAAVSRGPVGGLAAFLLGSAARRLRTVDVATTMTEKDAWCYLASGRLPPRSDYLAKLLLDLKESLARLFESAPTFGGRMPFLIAPPELVFQDFVTAKCLLALGLPHADLRQAMVDAHTPTGFRFGDYVAWADTPFHELKGWRDQTGKPAGYEPDLVVVDVVRRRTILLDAKFRRDSIGILPSSGIKDMQAYMHEYGLAKAIVAVPSMPGDPLYEDVSAKGFTIRGIALSPGLENVAITELGVELARMWNDYPIEKGMQFQ